MKNPQAQTTAYKASKSLAFFLCVSFMAVMTLVILKPREDSPRAADRVAESQMKPTFRPVTAEVKDRSLNRAEAPQPFAGESTHSAISMKVPPELEGDGYSADRFASLIELHGLDPDAALREMHIDYTQSTNAKGFWAAKIAYAYLDDLKDPGKAMDWLETAIKQKSTDRNLVDTLAFLYVDSKNFDRAEYFLKQIDQENVQTLLAAKLLIERHDIAAGVELMRSLPIEEMDHRSIDTLKRYGYIPL